MHKHHHPGLLVVDIQGKAGPPGRGERRPDCQYRQAGARARVLGLPVVWLEQNPDKLGATVPELQSLQAGDLVLPKYSFGALGEPTVATALAESGDRALAGMWHRDPYLRLPERVGTSGQRRPGLAGGGCGVVSHRCQPGSRHRPACGQGAALTSVEMCLYELMGTAAIRHFARSSPW